MKHRLLHHPTVAEMLDDDALEECRSHAGVPDALRVHDDNGSADAHAEARRLATLDATRPEQQSFALE